MTKAFTIVLAVVGGLALLGIVLFLILRGVRGSIEHAARERLARRYPDPGAILRVEYFAYCAGFESAGVAQIRGNGALALTRSELWWYRAQPAQEVAIPLSDIEAIDFTSSHVGKMLPGQRLLRVRFRMTGGGSDSAAWLVNDPDAWLADLNRARESAD